MIKYLAVLLFEIGESACDFPNLDITNDSDTSITQAQFLK